MLQKAKNVVKKEKYILFIQKKEAKKWGQLKRKRERNKGERERIFSSACTVHRD